MANYNFNAKARNVTPQSAPIPGRESEMTKNFGGGYAFKATDWTSLRRWLLTGSMSGGYYQGKNEMTEDNMKLLSGLIQKDSAKVANEILDCSKKAISNHTAIFALTFLSSGDVTAKNSFKEIFPEVVRTASQLYEFMGYVKSYRGNGSVIHKAVNSWLSNKSVSDLEYQFLKYQSREGFSGRDILRLVRPKSEGAKAHLYNWITGGSKSNPLITVENLSEELAKIKAYETLKKGASEGDVIDAIHTFNLTHEMIPANITRTKGVWSALFETMPVGATIRNLGNLTNKEVFKDTKYLDMLEEKFSRERLAKGYVHPLALASAYKVYSAGGSLGKSSLTWSSIPRVQDILEEAINLSFETLEPTGKSFFYGLDVSGSMKGPNIAGLWMTPYEVEGIMSLASIKSEKNYFVGGFNDSFEPISTLRKNTSYRDALRFWNKGFGGTDASLAFDYATKNKIFTDVFVLYTDNETWAGYKHPTQALKEYRSKVNSNAKAIYVTICPPYSDNITLVDPKDNLSYDISGFTADTPKVIQMIAQDIL